MPKPLNRNAWLTRHTPGPKDRHIESAWLDEHYLYGGSVHEEAGAVISAALRTGTTRAVGHALYLKLFAEYANALEVAGAWGWAIRTRRQHPLFLDAFLTYGPEAPSDFYTAARRNRSGSAVRLLDLPAEAKVIEALAGVFGDWSADQRRAALELSVRQARSLARHYLADDRLIPRIFNRTKHGATLLHDESLSLREFWVLAPHFYVSGPPDKARYLMPKFTVNREMILSTERDLANAAALIRFLAGLAKALNDAGILYPPSHPLTRARVPQRIPPQQA